MYVNYYARNSVSLGHPSVAVAIKERKSQLARMRYPPIY